MLRMLHVSLAACVLTPAFCQNHAAVSPSSYETALTEWRAAFEREIAAGDGWLTVAGLFWLAPRANSFGSSPSSDIVLPAGAPARVGVFEMEGSRVRVRFADASAATVNGRHAGEAWLATDHPGPPDLVRTGSLTLFVIERGGRLGIRLKDPNSEARLKFRGLEWYPPSPRYRVEGRFLPYAAARTVEVASASGGAQRFSSPGLVEFTLNGRKLRLEPVLEQTGASRLFFIFRDLTAGKSTYPAGRFLYSGLPRNGRVVLDFNRAENPPCTFTPYATCPLAPAGNRLPVAIEAGEKYRGTHGGADRK